MTRYYENIIQAFNAAKKGRRDLTKWLNPEANEAPIYESLAIAIKNSGRYTCRVFLQGFDLYGDADQFFKLGALCWLYSLRDNFDEYFIISLQSQFTSDYPHLVIFGYDEVVSDKNKTHFPRCTIVSDISTISPLAKFRKFEKNNPSFGVFDRNSLGYWCDTPTEKYIEKAVVLTASRDGLRAIARSLMTFSALSDRYEEIHFCHDGIPSGVGLFSYEANIFRTGSFAGDAIFDNF